MVTALFIGRFQPMHVGHLQAINAILTECDHLIIGLGSAEKSRTCENPFNAEERKQMIEQSIDMSRCVTVPIPDVEEYSKWVHHVISLCPKFDIVYTGNAVVWELFEKEGYELRPVKEEIYVSSTSIRDMVASGDGKWKEYVPKKVIEVIKKINGEARIKSLCKVYKNPIPVTDIIIEQGGKIVLIKRHANPFKNCWALPGGFIDYGETSEHAAIREAKEETSLKVKLKNLVGVYSKSDRDPRGHNLSIVYSAKVINGKLKAGDDAKEAKWVSIKDLKKLKLAFDHADILKDYLKDIKDDKN